MPNEGDIVRNKRTGEQAVWRGGRPVPMGGGAPAARGPVYGAPPRPTPAPAPKQYEPPSGYMGGPEQLRPIPGGPADKPDPADKADAPYSQSAIDAFDRAIGTAGRLKKHPGFNAAIGMPSINPFDGNLAGFVVPGSRAADFRAELDALKAQVFLPMVQSMKGLGALSNAEGQKLTDAIGALDPRMSEDGFSSSLDRIIGDLKSYRDRGKAPAKASGTKRLRYNPATGELE